MLMTETEEVQTENEFDLYEIAKKQSPDYLKAVELHDARKKKVENDSRLMSGIFMLALGNLSFMLGTLYMTLIPLGIGVVVFYELRKMKRNQDKDNESSIKLVEWMIFFILQVVALAKGSFRRRILENSGFS